MAFIFPALRQRAPQVHRRQHLRDAANGDQMCPVRRSSGTRFPRWTASDGTTNLPELFVAIFALRAGLDTVVQAALVGSILGNSLLVFGLALFLGGLKNGTQRFKSEPPRMIATLMLLAVAALIVPTLARSLNTP